MSDNSSDEAFPDLFTTVPQQPPKWKPGQLNYDQLNQFFQEGYVVVEDFFQTRDELDPVRRDVELLVDELAQELHKDGKISQPYSELDLDHRLVAMETEFPGTNILMLKRAQLPSCQSFRNLWSNKRLLNVAEQLIGSADLSGHPVWNLRCKTPRSNATTVPWHQDAGYMESTANGVMQVTAWVPLVDATKDTGCVEVMPGGHRSGKVAKHHGCWRDTWYIMAEPDEMAETLGVDVANAVECPVPYGGVLLFNNMIPHRSLENESDRVRWSLDLRWQKSDQPVGFYGMKDGVRMRSSDDPNFKIDWDSFLDIKRHEETGKSLGVSEEDKYNMTITGPWMKKWQMTNVNQHVQAYLDSCKGSA
ncbi:hypothetical protein CAPTEDRAFT_227964 [Capitella teleta]|uniref:Fe2OG dioxygenase domain-containing protein n=1 Tax=Capitella teleta TaxID=283909 RepID=R7TRK2_CAPTE|nr:hypothetical protein CAPTEDRAFT_227964 [Capitella teleta]|eukprot:ELT94126.1 hypothetical protein CAPTEDRAFT_227964 [Capitella teleta]